MYFCICMCVCVYMCDRVCVCILRARASETLTGVTQSKIGDVYLCIYLYIWTYVCHFVL